MIKSRKMAHELTSNSPRLPSYAIREFRFKVHESLNKMELQWPQDSTFRHDSAAYDLKISSFEKWLISM
ncbi:hypothetical protein TNCV_1552081 [Trichonephila clavipes]|nr:hypothetical protein TNCV_1552081 [Trichonephila clavipes]